MIYDKDIREKLFDYLDTVYLKNRIIEEKRIGKSRADIMMVLPDCICGIEIKSDADTYSRLSNQINDYNTYFDKNIIVVGSSHASHIDEHVPDEWGIISVEQLGDGSLDFYEIRKPSLNCSCSTIKKLSLLWRPELANIQNTYNLPAYKLKSKLFVISKIAEKLPKDIINQAISDELFERDYNLIAEKINAYRTANGMHKRRNTKRKKRRYSPI